MPTSNLIHAALSDPGRVRRHNEDAFGLSPAAGIFVLCDGMGGAAAGEIASQIAVEAFVDFLANPRSPSGSRRVTIPDNPSNTPQHNPQTRLHAAILAANRAILDFSENSPDLKGMGTTLVALFHPTPHFRERRSVPRPSTGTPRSSPATLFLANVGDSRCYRLRHGVLHQLSEDHSLVEEQLRAGQITPEQAVLSPLRNVLTRALGAHAHVEPDIQSYRPEPGDLFLLASDGLTRELADLEIEHLLNRTLPPSPTSADLDRAAHALVEESNRHGGEDNISVILVAVPEPSAPPS